MDPAICEARSIAHPLLLQSRESLKNSETVLTLCEACVGSTTMLRTALRAVLLRCRLLSQSVRGLIDAGLFIALRAAVESGLGVRAFTGSGDLLLSSCTRLRLCLCCLRSLRVVLGPLWVDAVSAAGIATSLCRGLASMTSSLSTSHSIVAIMCDVLQPLLSASSVSAILRAHKCGVTHILVTNLKADSPIVLSLLAELLRTCSACRYILRSSKRTTRVMNSLLGILTEGNPSHRSDASFCIAQLMNNSLPKVTNSISQQSKEILCTFLLGQLDLPDHASTAVYVLRSCVGHGSTAHLLQFKGNRGPKDSEISSAADIWSSLVQQFDGCSRIVSWLSFCSLESDHKIGYSVIRGLAERGVFTLLESQAAIQCVCASIQYLIDSEHIWHCERALWCLSYLVMSPTGLIKVTEMNSDCASALRTSIMSIAMLCGITFDSKCRVKRFVHVPTDATKEISCPICMEEDINDEPCMLACGHVMHSRCIRKWKDTSFSCPVCRSTGFDLVLHILGPRKTPISFVDARHHLRF